MVFNFRKIVAAFAVLVFSSFMMFPSFQIKLLRYVKLLTGRIILVNVIIKQIEKFVVFNLFHDEQNNDKTVKD